jgi:hypothetical protein
VSELGGLSWQGGWNEPGVLSVVIVAANQPGTGIFIYSGTPAAGNSPIAWITNNSLKDPFGNSLPGLAGSIGSVGGSGSFQAFTWASSFLQWYSASSQNGPWTNGASVVAGNNVDGDLDISTGTATPMDIYLGNGSIVVRAPTAIGNLTGVSFELGHGWVAQINQADETWNTMSLPAGFTAGAVAPKYRLMPDNTVRLRGGFTLNGAQAANTVFWTIPANYVPAINQFYAAPTNLSGYVAGGISVRVLAAGTAQIGVNGINGNFVTLDGLTFTLDA